MTTPTITHYVDGRNVITVKEAVSKGFPILAVCGFVWVPQFESAHEELGLPLCEACDRLSRPANRTRRGTEPHYVYRHFDEQGDLLYVGCTVDPRVRKTAHKTNSWWFDQVVTTRMIVFPDRAYALEKERQAITDEHPRFNIKGRWQHRSMWEAEHYYMALIMAPDSHARRPGHLEKVVDEAKRRYGLELEVAS
jgi:hypothetical protein